VQFRVSANPNGTSRESGITVNNQRAIVRQDGTSCRFDVSVSSAFFTATGGVGTATVTGPAGCAWTASSDVSWITLSAAGGTGSGSVSFNVANNGGATRTGTLVVAGTTISVTEASGAPVPCTVSLQPTSMAMPAAGGPGKRSDYDKCGMHVDCNERGAVDHDHAAGQRQWQRVEGVHRRGERDADRAHWHHHRSAEQR
jgi:hypothetical protein